MKDSLTPTSRINTNVFTKIINKGARILKPTRAKIFVFLAIIIANIAILLIWNYCGVDESVYAQEDINIYTPNSIDNCYGGSLMTIFFVTYLPAEMAGGVIMHAFGSSNSTLLNIVLWLMLLYLLSALVHQLYKLFRGLIKNKRGVLVFQIFICILLVQSIPTLATEDANLVLNASVEVSE